jgi:hypothetical protein
VDLDDHRFQRQLIDRCVGGVLDLIGQSIQILGVLVAKMANVLWEPIVNYPFSLVTIPSTVVTYIDIRDEKTLSTDRSPLSYGIFYRWSITSPPGLALY